MKVIIEEIDNQVGHIITFEETQSYYIEESLLPKGVKVGAIYDVKRSTSGELEWNYLADETKIQLNKARKKRERLKRRQ